MKLQINDIMFIYDTNNSNDYLRSKLEKANNDIKQDRLFAVYGRLDLQNQSRFKKLFKSKQFKNISEINKSFLKSLDINF